MADTTSKKNHAEAVDAVVGNLAPEPDPAQEEGIVVTRDLASEQDKDAKLDAETEKATTAYVDGLNEEREQRAVRTLANGKTEAVLEEAPAAPVFPPDDGGYNPEKRVFAGPDGTKVPSAVGKNRTDTRDNQDLLDAGWREREIK